MRVTHNISDTYPKCSYHAFGSSMPGLSFRHDSLDGYRYGFNNQEKENELGDYYSFEYRVHDARLGRFLSVDPLGQQFPWNSSYSFAENKVIVCIELEGLEAVTAKPANYNYFKTTAITIFNSAKATGASDRGALLVLAHAVREAGYTDNASCGYNLFGLMRDNTNQASLCSTGHGHLISFANSGGIQGCITYYFNSKLRVFWPDAITLISNGVFDAEALNAAFNTFDHYVDPANRKGNEGFSYHGSDGDGTAKSVNYGQDIINLMGDVKAQIIGRLNFDLSTYDNNTATINNLQNINLQNQKTIATWESENSGGMPGTNYHVGSLQDGTWRIDYGKFWEDQKKMEELKKSVEINKVKVENLQCENKQYEPLNELRDRIQAINTD